MLLSCWSSDVCSSDLPNPPRMLLWGRATMVVATMLGVVFASLRLDILVMLVFVGALWGAIVFPVIVSFYWDRVTNKAFTTSVLCAEIGRASGRERVS